MSPQQVTTVLIVVGWTTFFIIGLLLIEALMWKKKGTDAIITNSFRAAVHRVPWLWILLALINGFMMGHCFGQ